MDEDKDFTDYSHKSFTGRTLIEFDIPEGTVITGSSFSQEEVDSEIFPAKMTGVTFRNCNLDNCKIPEGNTVIDCSTRRFKAQSDGHDWEVDDRLKPVRPLDWKMYEKRGEPVPSPDTLKAE